MSRKPTQPQQDNAPKMKPMEVFIKTDKEDEKKETETQYKHLLALLCIIRNCVLYLDIEDCSELR